MKKIDLLQFPLTSRLLTLMNLHSCFSSIWLMCFCPKKLFGCFLICNSNLRSLSFVCGWLRDKGYSLDETVQEIQMTSFISYWLIQTGTSKWHCYWEICSLFFLIVMTTLVALISFFASLFLHKGKRASFLISFVNWWMNLSFIIFFIFKSFWDW